MSYDFFALHYDSLTENVDYEKCVQFLHRNIQKYKPGCKLIADLACGTGNISLPLSRLGYDVIGIDSSAQMLSQAMQKQHEGILWLCQDLRRLDLYGTIEAAVCVLDSVNHILPLSSLKRAFERISLFIEPGGVFIFDCNTPYKHEHILASNAFIYETDDVFCAWRNSYEGDGLVEITLDFFAGAPEYRRYTERFREQAYSHEQILELLGSCGLELLDIFDDYTDTKPCKTTQRTVYITRKK